MGNRPSIEKLGVFGKWYHISMYSPQKDHFVAMLEDITDRKKAEEALKESEQRLRSVLDSSLDAIYRFNLQEDSYEYVSPAFEPVVGYSPEEMSSMSLERTMDLIHPDDLNGVNEALARLIKEGAVVYDYRLQDKSGKYRWVSNHLSLVKDGSGKPLYRDGVVSNITERKKAEEAIEEQRSRLQAVLETAPIGIFVGDVHGATVLMNKAFDDIWKGPAPKPSGVSEYDKYKAWFADSGKEIGSEDWPTARGLKGEASSIVANIERFDGSRGSILALATPMRDQAGKVTGVIGIVQDITEMRRAEEELIRSNTELQQFAYVASHDLQEPLRMVTAYLGLLEKKYGDKLDDDAKKYMDFAVEGGLRARDLIRDMLEYSRVDSNAKEFVPVNMSEVVEDTIRSLKVPIEENKANIYVEPLPTIMADGSQMSQVMQNLIDNAIKFHGDERPSIHISASEGTNEWKFAVRDNGIGLNTEYADKIFQMFQRLHQRETYPGTGVGLAVCKKIVERHGGRIWVESDGKNGSTFYFTIPKVSGGGEIRWVK